jgi:hypothetical protein
MSSKRADEASIPAWRSETLPQLRPNDLERLVTAFRVARLAFAEPYVRPTEDVVPPAEGA